MNTEYELDRRTGTALLNFSGATDEERSAARRMLAFQGTEADVIALIPLAHLLGIPWREMFPDLVPESMSSMSSTR